MHYANRDDSPPYELSIIPVLLLKKQARERR